MKLTVQSLFDTYGTALGLIQTEASKGMEQELEVFQVQRPGLSLAGYIKRREDSRILIFGRIEIEYLQEISSDLLQERLLGVITTKTPIVIVSRGKQPPQELVSICQELKVPLLCTQMGSMELMGKLSRILNEALTPRTSLHGTFVEIFGVGVSSLRCRRLCAAYEWEACSAAHASCPPENSCVVPLGCASGRPC